MQELYFEPATTLARRIAAGHLSARDCLESFLSRVQGLGKALNAVVIVDVPRARREADAADAVHAAGRSLGPLHGVPMTVKDSFDLDGLPSTFGYAERTSHRANRDALAVERLREAGAIVFGKTNVPKDLADWQSFNAHYGETLNPWDRALSPGGSSGGAAAALAAGLTALEIGSDIGGSIRIPAHFCGVYGHKPSFGIVPMRGHSMRDGAASDISVAGPLARSASDLEMALRVIAGADPAERGAWRLALPEEPRRNLADFRFAIVADDPAFPVDDTIASAIRRLADGLRRAGAEVDEAPALPIGSQESYRLYLALLRGATSARLTDAQFRDLARASEADGARDDYEALMRRGLTQSHRDWLAANDRRESLRHAWRGFFDRYDALIAPVATTPAFPRMPGVPKPEQRFTVNGNPRPAADTYYWLSFASTSYLPATTVPLGIAASGLPVGAQIIGPEFGDLTCLRIADLVEQAFGGFTPPPMRWS